MPAPLTSRIERPIGKPTELIKGTKKIISLKKISLKERSTGARSTSNNMITISKYRLF